MSAVFDASVVVKWFVDDPLADAAIEARRTHAPAVAPDLMLIEVANVFRRYVVRGELQSSSAAENLSIIPQVLDLVDEGVNDFHFYSMNRSDLVYAICISSACAPRRRR